MPNGVEVSHDHDHGTGTGKKHQHTGTCVRRHVRRSTWFCVTNDIFKLDVLQATITLKKVKYFTIVSHILYINMNTR